jgi:hypothetical protein
MKPERRAILTPYIGLANVAARFFLIYATKIRVFLGAEPGVNQQLEWLV